MATSGSFNTSSYDGRYLTFSWTVTGQSITDNTTTISWTLRGAGGNSYNYYQARNIRVTLDGATVYSFPQASGYIDLYVGTVVASGTYTFTHAADGTKAFTAYVEAGIYNWAVNCTGSGTFTLDQIKRRSVISGSNGTLGSANTLKLTRYNSAFTDTITAVCGTASVEIVSGSAAEKVAWTPPIDWAAQNVSATSVAVTVTCKTYSGSTLLGETSTTLTFAIPASVVPTISLAVSDAKGYLAAYGSYIQNKSQAAVSAVGEGVYGSTIQSYIIGCGLLSGTGANLTFNLPDSGRIGIMVKVTDSRGRSASASTIIDVTAYSAPRAEITSRYRCDADGNEDYLGNYAVAVFNSAVTSLGGKNSAAYALKYRIRGTTAWTSISIGGLTGNYAPAGVSQIFPAGVDNSYDVCIAVTDNFGTIESAYRTVQLGSPIMDVDRDNRALGFFQRAVDANTVAFGLPAKFSAGATLGEEFIPTEAFDAATKKYADSLQAYNHLDNSYFLNPVIQRGTFPARWTQTGCTTEITADGIVLAGGLFYQNLTHNLNNKFITAAVCFADGTLAVASAVCPIAGGTGSIGVIKLSLGNGRRLDVNLTRSTNVLQFIITPGSYPATVQWAALYEGEYNAKTLPGYRQKGYAAELRECRRYSWPGFRVNATRVTGNYFAVSASFPTEFRITPTYTLAQFDAYGVDLITDFTDCYVELNASGIFYAYLPTCAEYDHGSLALDLNADL